MEEFEETISMLIKHQGLKIPATDIMDIAHSIDINKDGSIDFNEFLEAFRIVDHYGMNCARRRMISTESEDLHSIDGSVREFSTNLNRSTSSIDSVESRRISRKVSRRTSLDEILEISTKESHRHSDTNLENVIEDTGTLDRKDSMASS